MSNRLIKFELNTAIGLFAMMVWYSEIIPNAVLLAIASATILYVTFILDLSDNDIYASHRMSTSDMIHSYYPKFELVQRYSSSDWFKQVTHLNYTVVSVDHAHLIAKCKNTLEPVGCLHLYTENNWLIVRV